MNTSPDGTTKKSSPFVEFLQSIVVAIAICVFVYVFIATPNQIDGISMNPTFENGQIILTNKLSLWLGDTPFGKSIGLGYSRGDVIVFQKPGYKDLIKRVIGLPGETIMLRGGKVYINENIITEEYISSEIKTNGGSFLEEGEEKTIPEGDYFVMGDNRNNSHDSRYTDIGFVEKGWIKGKALLRYWPLNKISLIVTPKYN